MNKKNIFLFIILLLTMNASALCDGPPDECDVIILNVTPSVHSGDEVDITIEFMNIGSEPCCYQAEVFDMHGNQMEKEPDIFWKDVKSGESEVITLSSNWDWGWDVCSIASSLMPGKGNFSVVLTGVFMNSKKYDCIRPVGRGDSCRFTGLWPPTVFDAPQDCCGEFEGTACLGYGTGYGGFNCNDSIQVNFNVSCLVYCTYDESIGECKCNLKEACAIDCIQAENSRCSYTEFVCAGPHYRCANGKEPTVICSTTTDCKYMCAAECGRAAACTSDCETCCESGLACGRMFPIPYGKEDRDVCMDACMGVCKANEQLCKVILIIQGILIASAVFVITLQGIKWMVSEDFEGRLDAKNGIVYVFIGLVLTLLSTSLASYFFTGSLVC